MSLEYQQSEAEVAVPVSNFICSQCGLTLPSRNKLFKHIEKLHPQQPKEVQCFKKAKSEHDGEGETFPEHAIYVMGGRLRGRTLASIERFDLGSLQWEEKHSSSPDQLPDMLDHRGSHGAVAISGRIYVIGGGGYEANLSSCEMLDCEGVVDARAWKYTEPMPAPARHALAVVAAGERVVCAGGWVDGSRCSDAVEALDTRSGSWASLPRMKTARRLHGLAVHGQTLFAFGGSCDDPHWHTSSVECLVMEPLGEWLSLRNFPFSGGMSAVTVGSFIYVFVFGKHVVRYDPSSDGVRVMSPLPLPEWHCFTTCRVGSRYVFVMGGAVEGNWSSKMFRYDTVDDSWSEMPSMKLPRRRVAAAVV